MSKKVRRVPVPQSFVPKAQFEALASEHEAVVKKMSDFAFSLLEMRDVVEQGTLFLQNTKRLTQQRATQSEIQLQTVEFILRHFLQVPPQLANEMRQQRNPDLFRKKVDEFCDAAAPLLLTPGPRARPGKFII